jgi:hypothetical protein
MPIRRSNHLARALVERQMADLSASNIERMIHNKLADLHWAAGHTRPGAPLEDGRAA